MRHLPLSNHKMNDIPAHLKYAFKGIVCLYLVPTSINAVDIPLPVRMPHAVCTLNLCTYCAFRIMYSLCVDVR